MAWDEITVTRAYFKLKVWFVENVDDLFALTPEDFLKLMEQKVRGLNETFWKENEIKDMKDYLEKSAKALGWDEQTLSYKISRLPNVGDRKWTKEISDESAGTLKKNLSDWFEDVKEGNIDVEEFMEEGEEI